VFFLLGLHLFGLLCCFPFGLFDVSGSRFDFVFGFYEFGVGLVVFVGNVLVGLLEAGDDGVEGFVLFR
jgi:hypothetical protein